MQETQVWFLDRVDPLEREMATHSSILVWRIPWTEEPGGLQSTGSQESDMTEHLTMRVPYTFVHSSVDGHLSCFHILAIIKMRVQVSLWDPDFNSFQYIPRPGIARLYGSSALNFLRNTHIVFHNGCAILHSHLHSPVCRDSCFSTFSTALTLIFIFW